VVFDKCRLKTFLQVLFRGTYWLRQWASLQQHDDQRDQLIQVGQFLETSTLQFLVPMGGCPQDTLVMFSLNLISFWFSAGGLHKCYLQAVFVPIGKTL
jgi:hypothetical protein